MVVSIDGVPCDVQSVVDTEIQCTTNSHSHSAETHVAVTVGQMRAVEVDESYNSH